MANPTLAVKDANQNTVTINTLPNAGQSTSASSLPVVLATDQPAIPVTGPATDAQMRASPIPVSTGGLTDTQLRANPVPVTTGGLTDVQLRANPVPVTGGITDVQLRATPVPVSISSNTGLGGMALVPNGSTNGTPLGSPSMGTTGFRIYLQGTDSVTFTMANTQPTSAPTITFTISASGTGPNWDERISGSQMMYITAIVGTPKFRWW